ncbi:MAG: prolyl oligopeptidase family serine peptidase [Thermoanaerobaculia bacterium]
MKHALRLAAVSLVMVLFAATWPAAAQAPSDVTYQKPPKEILELVDVKLPPLTFVDPANRYLVLLDRPGFKALEELAQPELRLAGLRINPRNHDRSPASYTIGMSIQEIASGRVINVTGLPDSIRIEYPRFSPKGRYMSLVEAQPEGLSLWVVELATGAAKRVTPPVLSAVMLPPCLWSTDESGVYCRVRPSLEPLLESKELPAGPTVQVAEGRKTPGRTWQDLLKSKADERKFEYYAATEVKRFDLAGQSRPVLPAGIYKSLDLSPDGTFLLVEQVKAPFSYQFPFSRFPYRAFIVDGTGATVAELADKPLQDAIPMTFDAVEAGRRDFQWRDDTPATVVWAEALDGGDPAVAVPQRDRVAQLDAPFTGEPRMLATLLNRFSGASWGDGKRAMIDDYWWKTRSVRTYLVDPSRENPRPKVVFEYSSEDLYHLPGDFVTAPNAFGRYVLVATGRGAKLLLSGEGYSPEGNKPFLDEYDLATGKTVRLWRADGKATYESIVRVLDAKNGTLLTRTQSPTMFPNYFVRETRSRKAPRQITSFANPFKPFEGVSKEKIHYKREDGVSLSADLYLPKGYDKARDGRLPVLIEAYPTEFKDKAAAGMVDSSPHQFTYLYWGSPVFWAARGYAVLEGAQFPIVGQGTEEPNDTYIEQLVMDARAAIKAVDDRGVVDPKRVGVIGHSYGAFMVVNLLAHSDLFAAGIARSGAYNRSLTPFGFQAEERSYWEAQSVYQKMSPFNYADRIKTPLLMIHGEADNNSGTFTFQSERLFQAVKGLGGTSRLVLLPFESHGYQAKDNIFHMLWEQDRWLETYVKNAKR